MSILLVTCCILFGPLASLICTRAICLLIYYGCIMPWRILYDNIKIILGLARRTSQTQNLERAMAECDKARVKFFRDGGDEAHAEWMRTCENEKKEGDSFATCDRNRALGFLQEVYPSRKIEDTPESAGPLLDFVEQDVVRIQDPMMYGKRIQVVPGTNWEEVTRDQVTKACSLFHEES